MAQKRSASKSNGAEKRETVKEPKPRALKIATAPPAESVSPAMSDEEIARMAYFLWESRGKPHGSPDEDWYKAKMQLGT